MSLGLFVLASHSIAAETPLLCVADMASGFAFDKSKGSWNAATFRTQKKYLVTKSSQKGFAWDIKEVGEKLPISACEKDFNEDGILTCDGFQEFHINKTNGRFLSAYRIGYWNDNSSSDKDDIFREGKNTPHMEIGKCSPL